MGAVILYLIDGPPANLSLSCFYRKIFRALDFSNVIYIHSHKLTNHKHVGQCILKKVAALYNQDPDQETK